MSRGEWLKLREENRTDGMPRSRFTKHCSKSDTIQKLNMLEYLNFGIGKWVYDQAVLGAEWALEDLNYGIHDPYKRVIEKAKFEGLL